MFKEVASIAADLERNGKFKKAAKIWSEAQVLAKKIENKQWCGCRRHYCEKNSSK